MTQGSFDIRFAVDAPLSLWNTIAEFGHIVITPQWVDNRLFDDATMLNMARYSGVVLERRLARDGLAVSGAGMVWWLGDEEGKGDIIETKVALDDDTLDDSLDALLPVAITKGTITEPPATYNGEHQWETPLEAIRTVCASMGAEYRVNPNGTIDAGPSADVYNITTPTVVVLREHLSGSDPILRGIEVEQLTTHLNSRPYATRGIVVTEDSDNVRILVGGQDRSPAPTATDLHGNVIDRTLMLETSGSPVDVTIYLTTQMNEHAIVSNMEISTNMFEIQNGDLRVGDAFWCYDPPAFVDYANQMNFRGDRIFPKRLRLIAASWPLLPGMGIYYRSPAVTPVYHDLSEYIAWEQGSNQRLGVRV